MDNLLKDLQYFKGVGPVRKAQLARLGLETPLDVLWHIPRDYIDAAGSGGIASLYLMNGQKASIRARVVNITSRRAGRRMEILKAELEDGTARICAVWFNQPHLKKNLQPGMQLLVTGTVKIGQYGADINVSDYAVLDDEDEEGAAILPVYPLTEGLSQKVLRRIIQGIFAECLPDYPEILDESLRARYGLAGIQAAIQEMHYPSGMEQIAAARRRLAFEEILVFKAALALEEAGRGSRAGICHSRDHHLVDALLSSMPFELTGAQKRAAAEIFRDMESPRAMNRLLQGDVGAGKTAVAALALAKAVGGGYQGAMMAPTEILARQHFKSLEHLFAGQKLSIALLAGSCPASQKRMIIQELQEGGIDILIGTHALIQEQVAFKNLGLAVIDEQHRFGVKQRSQLAAKGPDVDVLVMTATPIPRTLALSVYGEQNTSWLDEMPPGRKPVKTRLLPTRLEGQAYDFLAAEIRRGHQAYIVCPLIEESEKIDLKNATHIFEKLSRHYQDIRFGLLHGKLPAAEKDSIMQAYHRGELQVLVSTTVIEVGLDNPRATVMLIEQAERFGLAQLHQLRGRVGRGDEQAFCILLGRQLSDEAWNRLQAMERTHNGFELAMADLQIRGPGDMMGWKQHGFSGFKVLNLAEDLDIIEACDEAVPMLDLDSLRNDPVRQNYISALGKYSSVL